MERRIFVAVDLPEPILEELATLHGGVPGARWQEDDRLHLTLRFIGEVDGHDYRDIVDALDGVRTAPFPLQLEGVGYFPPRGPMRVLWAGVARSPELKALRDEVERCVVGAGVEPERRKFHPHITVARLKDPPTHKVARWLEAHALFRPPEFRVDAFHIVTSRLYPDGARYSIEETYELEG